MIKVFLKILGTKSEATGQTTEEAIRNLTPKAKKGLGIFRVEAEGKFKERVFPKKTMERLFSSNPSVRRQQLEACAGALEIDY